MMEFVRWHIFVKSCNKIEEFKKDCDKKEIMLLIR